MLHRWLAVSLITIGLAPALVRADAFDNYINSILVKTPEAKGVEKVAKLTPEQMVQHNRALPGITATFVVVKTNEGRFAKLLIHPGRQKISDQESLPIINIERYVTYRDGEEKTILAASQNVRLFGGFRFNLDIGQVVPNNVPADLHVGVEQDNFFLEPLGKAEIYLVTKHLPEASPAKSEKLVVGEKFESRFFNGSYKLHDDGRRSGTINLKVRENGDVVGSYYSDKDGKKYDVEGRINSSPQHAINFTIIYPRTVQTFTGFLFTGNGQAITGTSRLQDREVGFYAERIEEK